MKFWVVDLEKELSLERTLLSFWHCLGLLGYVVMWIFISFFIATRASPYLDKSILGIVCGGFYLLIFVVSFSQLRRKLTLNSIVPLSGSRLPPRAMTPSHKEQQEA